MCGIYVVSAVIVLIWHIADIPAAFGAIFSGAFSPAAAYGGIVGVLIQGFRRAAFSNEAGIGSAAIAHSAVRTKEPITEGLVALLEPFIDTVVICTMTALVLVITGVYTDSSIAGVEMTSVAFESVFGNVAAVILTLAVVLFAFSTMISWSYYGMKAWGYLVGDSKAAQVAYKAVFCVFVVIGSVMALDPVIGFSDAMIFAMCFPNILGLYILSPGVRDDLNSFFKRIKSGEIKKYK
jgi:AGCS family alanine or glycine:cation symporter